MNSVTLDAFPFGSDSADSDEGLESVGSEIDLNGATSPSPRQFRKSQKDKVYYRCEKCSYQTEIQRLFDRHVSKHGLDRPFQCSMCDFSDYNHLTFVDHWIGHQDSKVLRCTFCSFKCSSPVALKTHIPKHRPLPMLDCSMCEFSSNYVLSMKNHIKAYHTTVYPCDECNEIMTKHELIKHCEEVHEAQPLHYFDAHTDCTTENPEPTEATSQIDHSIEFKPTLVRNPKSGCGHHNCNCSPEEPDELLESPASPKLETEVIPKYETDELTCSLCKFQTTNHLSLKYHRVVFHKKKFNCDYCPAVMTKHDMNQHVLKEHEVEIARSIVKNGYTRKDPDGSAEEAVTSVPHMPDEVNAEHVAKYLPTSTKRRDLFDRHKYELIQHYWKMHGIQSSTNVAKEEEQKHQAAIESVESESHEEESNSQVETSGGVTNKCPYCGYLPSRKAHMVVHLHKVHTVKYSCNNCPAIMTKYELFEHSWNVHGLKVPVNTHFEEAVSGDKAVQNSRELKAIEASDGKQGVVRKFSCRTCTFTTTRKHCLAEHEKRLHKKRYACKLCKAVMTKYRLRLHSEKKHGLASKVRESRRDIKQRVGKSRRYELRKPTSPLKKYIRRKGASYRKNHSSGKRVHKSVKQKRLGVGEMEALNSSEKLTVAHESSNMFVNPKFKSQSVSLQASLFPPDSPKPASGLLQCHNCRYQTQIKSLMRRHVLVHMPEGQFVCPKCAFKSNNTSAFAQHVRSHNKPKGSGKCCFCSFSTACLRSFKEHINTHRSVSSYYCSKCPFATSQSAQLSRHKLFYHSGNLSPNTCRPTVPRRSLGMPKMTSGRQGSSSKIKGRIEQKSEQHKVKVLKCKTCEYRTEKEDLLRRHEVKHAPIKCPICGSKSNTGYSFSVHLSKHNPPESPFKCFYCGHVSKCVDNLTVHLSLHVEALRTKDCPKCEFSCIHPHRLKRHLAKHFQDRNGVAKRSDPAKLNESSGAMASNVGLTTSVPETSESLATADMDSKSKRELSPEAMSSVKPPESKAADPGKQRPCKRQDHQNDEQVSSKCSKQGSKPESSKSTKKMAVANPDPCPAKIAAVSNPKLKFQCHNCSYQTEIKSLMRRHIVLHLPEGQFVCPKCDFRDSISMNLARHLASHGPSDPYKCCFCDFSSHVLTQLGYHLKKHRLVGDYCCSKCEFSAVQLGHLESHYTVYHTKKFSCPKCPKIATKFNLMVHIKRRHPSYVFKQRQKLSKGFEQKNSRSASEFANQMEKTPLARDKRGKRQTLKSENLSCKKIQRVGKELLSETKHPSPSHGVTQNKSDVTSKLQKKYSVYSELDLAVLSSPDFELSPCDPHQCPKCDFRTRRQDLFDRHVAKHESLKCPVCGIVVSKRTQFAEHLVKHNHQRDPCRCHYCGHVSRSTTNLLCHLALHVSALKIFDCPLCEFCSNRANYLGSHISNVHKPSKSHPSMKSKEVSTGSSLKPATETKKVFVDSSHDRLQMDNEASSLNLENPECPVNVDFASSNLTMDASTDLRLSVEGNGDIIVACSSGDAAESELVKTSSDSVCQLTEESPNGMTSMDRDSTVPDTSFDEVTSGAVPGCLGVDPSQGGVEPSATADVTPPNASSLDKQSPSKPPLTWNEFAKRFYKGQFP